MGETLICSICREVLYNPVSLVPCLHNFCAGCYSGWSRKIMLGEGGGGGGCLAAW